MSLQLQAMTKDQQRIQHKRDVLQKVKERISNPGLPAVDPAALDSQIREKRQKEIMEKEAEKLERERVVETERILEAAALEERKMKELIRQQMREDMSKSMQSSTGRKARNIEAVVPENCGISACQSFIGEDPNSKDRQRLQKAQMRRWIEEQMREKEEKKRKENDEDNKYFQYMKMVDENLGDDSKEEAQKQRRKMVELSRTNKEMADDIARAKAEEKAKELSMNEDEISATMSLSFMLEDVGAAVTENGKVTRKDNFKGFTAEQTKKIYKDNQLQIAKQRESEKAAKEREAEMEAQTTQAARQQEKALLAIQMKREMERKQQMAQELKAQAEEQSSKKAASKAERFGSIEGEDSMFSKFNGRS